MSRALRFTKAEQENAARICREHGVAVKMARDGSLLIFPAPSVDMGDDIDLDAELAAFEAKHGND